MRRSSSLYAVGLVLAATALVVPLREGTVAAATTGSPGQQRWVTLVTGDRALVRVNGDAVRLVTVEPGKGRSGMSFRHRSEHGDEYVVPADAAALIKTNRVDRRLFDVSLLVRSGYDDRSRTTLPLVLSGQAAAGVPIAKALASVSGGATELKKADAAGFWRSVTADRAKRLTAATSRIWLDGKVRAALDKSVPRIGAPEVWKAGHTGKGVTVAVLDSGIDAGHPDLTGAVVEARDFSGSPYGAVDKVGHGTHVAGIITGNGRKYVGVAPDATLLNGKVLDDNGFGMESWTIAGMEWAVQRGAQVVNMSLGGLVVNGEDPMAEALDRLSDQSGTLFVTAAGNSGPYPGSISTPGTADRALTVGAVDHTDSLADFSGRGPRERDGGLKPDVTAPGVGIVSALAPGSRIANSEPVVDDHYVALSGTSMATPHAAGAAALLAGEHPGWKATELKAALMGTAVPRDGVSLYAQGAGRIDVAAAAKHPVFATPSSVDAGTARWPHHDDKPVDKALTYHNDGDAALTLHLEVLMKNPSGDAPPAGMFTLSPAHLTVPAHGTATAHLVADTRIDAPDGRYEGFVVASGGGMVVRTPVGLTREVESYDVGVRAIGPDGAPATEHWASFANVDTRFDASTDGTTVRLPKGTYFVLESIAVPTGPEDYSYVLGAEPAYTVDGPKTLTIDARRAKPIGFELDRPDAALAGSVNIGFFRTVAGNTDSDETIGPPSKYAVIPSRTSAPPGQFTYRVVAAAGKADGNGGFSGSPYGYVIEWKHDRNVPADLSPRLRNRDFARIEHTFGESGPDQQTWLGPVGPLARSVRITQFVSPGLEISNGVGLFREGDADPHTVYYSLPSTYQRGQVARKQWNYGVFGPALAAHPTYSPYLVRDRSVIYAGIPLYGDRSADHIGFSTTDTMRLALSKDGEPVGESARDADIFTVPDDPGTYRLEATATRSNSTYTTRLAAAWTFTSARAVNTTLPVMVVRFAPHLDDHNAAKAGKRSTYPVFVQQGAGATYGNLTTLTVEVSYDDGVTWKAAPVSGTGLDRKVTVYHPAGKAFVSLRATAADDRGTSVTQTIIRAYGLR
ncbi:S8 family serine peptidase [Phytohabitans sp. LJ34]|uniref:S8 family serine peptidase n=1 Tax=Phytohabitans sp. LJ34 TaxID=3452217 RepID=UPI003F8B049C